MALKKEIANAITRDGKYIPLKIWTLIIDEPDIRDGTQTMTIEITVRKRMRKSGRSILGVKKQ